MDPNVILNPVVVRLMGDEGIKLIADTDPLRVVKGPRKPEGMHNPCITVHVLTSPRDPDYKDHIGTLQIKFCVDDYSGGNANAEVIGAGINRIAELFDDKPLEIEGFFNYNLVVEEPLGPLREPSGGTTSDLSEHFGLVRIRFGIARAG